MPSCGTNILHSFGFEIWIEPSYFATQKTTNFGSKKKWPKLVAIKKITNFGFAPDYL